MSPWLVPELTGAQWVEPLPQASYNMIMPLWPIYGLPLSYMYTPSFYTYTYTFLRFRVHVKS